PLGDNPQGGGGGEPQGGATPERPTEAVAAATPEPAATPPPTPELKVNKQDTPPLPKPEDVNTSSQTITRAVDVSTALQQMSEEAKNRHKQALAAVAKGKGGPGEGGGAGGGKGTGVGDGDKPGIQGSMASDREKRILRWTLRFNTVNGNDYAHQLAGLGAILAIPEPDGTFRVIRDLKHLPVKGEIEDINNINRIFWIDNVPESVNSLTRALRISPPPYVVAFFPE